MSVIHHIFQFSNKSYNGSIMLICLANGFIMGQMIVSVDRLSQLSAAGVLCSLGCLWSAVHFSFLSLKLVVCFFLEGGSQLGVFFHPF